jgi:hypothetical protein
MTKFLLTLHVLAAVLAVGPVAVAGSMFPPALRRALATPGDAGALTALRVLHRICRVYAGVGIAVPVLGLATASSLGVLGSGWLTASIVLTTVAAAVLLLSVLPHQERALASATSATSNDDASDLVVTQHVQGGTRVAGARLAMSTGLFNVLWAAVTVLMIIRPGSTTGA